MERFQVVIIGEDGNEKQRKYRDYVPMGNEEHYKIKLINNGDTRCDAEIKLENVHVGTWRVNPHASIIIERPAHVYRSFVFIDESSRKARESGVVPGSDTNGLLEVTFFPELPEQVMEVVSAQLSPTRMARHTPERAMFAHYEMQEAPEYSSGATVLGGYSGQRFRNVSPITLIDKKNVTTIILRLVLERESYKSLRSSIEAVPRIEKLGHRFEDISKYKTLY